MTTGHTAAIGTIPKIIHQIWKTNLLPDYANDCWQNVKGWQWRIWTDTDLLALVENHYPQLLNLYTSYPKNIQRADLGRYLILDHCGGFYTDLDTEYLGGLDSLAKDNRVILCEEPSENFFHSKLFGLDRLYFNGTLAGPAKHPFWAHLIGHVEKCRHASARVLESTGPIVLTGAITNFENQAQLNLNSCHLFCPMTASGIQSTAPQHGPLAPLRVSNHLWHGSWWNHENTKKIEQNLAARLKYGVRRFVYQATCRPQFTHSMAAARINQEQLLNPTPPSGHISILIPVRDSAPFLGRCMQLLNALEYPRDKLSLTFCEGDSTDETLKMLHDIQLNHKKYYSSIDIIQLSGGPKLDRALRWMPVKQYKRRAHLAKVRNHLIDFGLHPYSNWALWLDTDICDYPSDILRILLAQNAKVVTPDCRLSWDGPSFDLNAFTETNIQRDAAYLKHVKKGLFVPPANFGRRHHLHDLRCVNTVPLTSVGGTMLLVAANVHRAGIRFPEIPYQDLLDTEGFGRLCHDFGAPPIGLPNTAILHRID